LDLKSAPRPLAPRIFSMPSSRLHPHEPPRIFLAQLPTPLVELHHLQSLQKTARLLLKRDDLTGLEVTGNKVRKLEYVVAAAQQAGADALVTHGGFQSNHCRATAAVAARVGLRCRLLLRSPENPANDGNLFLDRLFGAQISLHPPAEYGERKQELIDQAMAEERLAGRTPYFFPVGASIPPGCWGYIRCLHEILEQVGRETEVDLFAPVSSSGTIAGLILGRALFDAHNIRVFGIPVSDSLEFFQQEIRKLIEETIAEYRLDLTTAQTPIDLIDGYIGQGYAVPTPQALETLKLLARSEGILLDPTYTAKAMAGFLDCAKGGRVRAGALAVFVHTGGVFGLMARRDLFE
jgi:D-cysteine desulfhydrase